MQHKKTLLILILMIVMAIFLAPFIYGFYVASTYQIAEITDLSVGYLKGDEIILSEEIPNGVEHIYVCGNLKTYNSNFITISLHDSTEQMFLGRGDFSGPYQAGPFCTELQSDNSLTVGAYKIIIIDQHERVGELLFRIK